MSCNEERKDGAEGGDRVSVAPRGAGGAWDEWLGDSNRQEGCPCAEDEAVRLLDVLRCLSPELMEKEVWMQVVAYNVIRALMCGAAKVHRVEVDRHSFKGAVDTLRPWTPLLAPALFVTCVARRELLRVIAADLVPLRSDRSEPRARKRRPKGYQLLTKPRRLMLVSLSRNLK